MEHNRIAARIGGLIVSGIFLLLLGAIFRTSNYFKETFEPQTHHNFVNQSELKVNGNRSDNVFNFPARGEDFPKRDKRLIIFNGNGVVKLVLGTSFPIKLADRVRSLSFFYNLQMQYTPFPRPVYWWSLFNTTTFPGSLRKAGIADGMGPDISREFIYTAIEEAFGSSQCLLKMICEISRQPFHIERNVDDSESWAHRNLIHQILNTIFTPKLPNIDAKYMQAHYNGVHGAICNYDCPKHRNWLERRSVFV